MSDLDLSPSDFPSPAHALTVQASFAAANFTSIFSGLAAFLGTEINTSVLTSVVIRAALTSFGDKSAIVQAVIDHADTVFPDPVTRPYILMVLNLLVPAHTAKLASLASSTDPLA